MIDSQVVAFTFVVAALTLTPDADTMREGAGSRATVEHAHTSCSTTRSQKNPFWAMLDGREA